MRGFARSPPGAGAQEKEEEGTNAMSEDKTVTVRTLDREHLAMWVAALRSGEFKQGYGALHSRGGYCCLGVLCEVAIRDGLPLRVERNADSEGNFWVGYDDDSTFAPHRVLSWLSGTGTDRTGTAGAVMALTPTIIVDAELVKLTQANYALDGKREGLSSAHIGREETVIWLNDHLLLSFAQIADVLERQYAQVEPKIN